MKKLMQLLSKYGKDEQRLLAENPSLENLYTFSNQREGVVEWIDFIERSNILVIGDEFGSILGVLLRKGLQVDIYEENLEKREFIKLRYIEKLESFTFLEGKLEYIEKKYHYILFLANKKGQGVSITEGGIYQTLHGLLEINGKLILACNNRFGMQTLAGAKEDEESLSRNEIQKYLTEAGFDQIHMYYPIYDYKLPFTIYSDEYLPSKGEISRYLPAYNYPEFLNVDLAKKFSQSAETGDFIYLTNSYIVITGARERAIYIKYNRTRREELRIKTVIEKDEKGQLLVCKAALNKKSKKHIQSLKEKYKKLLSENGKVTYVQAKFSEDGEKAYFPFIKGKSVTQYLGEKIINGELPYQSIKEALEIICGEQGTANHDAIFDNFIYKDGAFIGIDYEWVQENALEKSYLYFRALRGFLESFQHKLLLHSQNEYYIFYKKFGIPDEEIESFEKMEEEFQEYVHGDSQKVYLDNYFVTPRTSNVIYHFQRETTIAKEREQGLRRVSKEKDTTIKKMTEVKRLTDNHVVNLESMVKRLQGDVANLTHQIHLLRRREALFYRIQRKAYEKFNEKYPKGSQDRKKFTKAKFVFTHPAEYVKLHMTTEGKNLLEGETKIGEEYLAYGKLVFPKFENPKVSIIIPVYNQIHYTYACLISILEHTKDISFEIIIADDVSTDATKEISKFVENIVIARNESNQGFLKNCNQATKYAKGQYIMFLNNDTKVTKGWLSSLVELIESDSSIGMVGSKLIYPDGRLQEAGGILWSDGSGWNYGRLDDPNKCEYNYVKEVDYISGAAILLSHRLWLELGGFDEYFSPAYCEDSDLAFAVRKAGYKVCYQPKSVVIHFEGISNGTDVHGTGLKHYQIENTKKLRKKWAKEFALQCENNGNPFRARERSKGKKIILFVDHYIPTYDKDAGSKTTYQYLQMLIKQGYILKFLGDNFAKQEPYASVLQQMGIEILYGNHMQGDIWGWIEKNAQDIHLVYLNRPHIASKYIDFIRDNTELKIVYYGHDLHFLRLQREFELTGDIEKKKMSEYWKSIEFTLMYKADMSYYPSQNEINCIHEIDPDIRVKAITAYVYDRFKDISNRNYSQNEGLLFVGGFAHPPNVDALQWFIQDIFPKIREKLDINFYIVGSNASEEIKALHNLENGIIFKGFVSDQELEELYEKVRLVVVPLRYGAGVKGKVVEALYYGSAVITTSVGAEGIPMANTVMRIADKGEDFAEEVLKLYGNIGKIQKMGEMAVEYIKDHNSYTGAWRLIKEEFR